jgi:hypothetical protein
LVSMTVRFVLFTDDDIYSSFFLCVWHFRDGLGVSVQRWRFCIGLRLHYLAWSTICMIIYRDGVLAFVVYE